MCLALDGEKSIYAHIELERKMRIGIVIGYILVMKILITDECDLLSNGRK